MSLLVTIWINFTLFYSIGKTLKFYKSNINRFLSLNDFFLIFFSGIVVAYSCEASFILLKILVMIMLVLGSVAIMLDVALFKLYTMELEPQAAKLFLKDRSTFVEEGKGNLIEVVFSWIGSWFIIWAALITAIFFSTDTFMALVQAIFFSYAIFVITKSRLKWYSIVVYLALIYPFYFIALRILEASYFLGGVCFALFLLCGYMLKRRGNDNGRFLHGSNSFSHILGIGAIEESLDLEIKDEDKILLKERKKKSIKSKLFGLCEGANVVVISIESLGRNYIDYYGGKAQFKVFDRLAKNSLISKYHYCVSSNTNNALYHFYNDSYDVKTPSSLLSHMNEYSSYFLTTQKIAPFKFEELIRQIGFEHIAGEEHLVELFDIPECNHWGLSDKAIVNEGLDWFFSSRKKDKPFYLHILNSQTHTTYHVDNKEKYNNFPDNKSYGRYLNAVEESGDLTDDILNKLESYGALDNTIVVVCGDHGQSFGEAGYKVHSNAITQEQILTPFLLWHPRLSGQKVDISSHFDILPTILDLVGIENVNSRFGQSLFSGRDFQNLLLYTKTKRGNAPSSFGYVDAERKILVDNVYKRIAYLNHNDKLIKDLSSSDKRYYFELALRVLKAHQRLF